MCPRTLPSHIVRRLLALSIALPNSWTACYVYVWRCINVHCKACPPLALSKVYDNVSLIPARCVSWQLCVDEDTDTDICSLLCASELRLAETS